MSKELGRCRRLQLESVADLAGLNELRVSMITKTTTAGSGCTIGVVCIRYVSALAFIHQRKAVNDMRLTSHTINSKAHNSFFFMKSINCPQHVNLIAKVGRRKILHSLRAVSCSF